MCCVNNVLLSQSPEVLKPVVRVLSPGYLSVHKRQEAVHFKFVYLQQK